MPRSSINSNSSPRGWLWIVLLVLPLAACTPEFIPAPTMTPFPTATSTPLPPTFTPTATIEYFAPTPIPTLPSPPILTPNATQVERWKEYQTALAKSFLRYHSPEDVLEKVLCEWEILGQSEQEVYVWVVCTGTVPVGKINPIYPSGSLPAVIALDADGTVKNVTTTNDLQVSYGDALRKLFPEEVREKFNFYNFGRAKEMLEHLEWRRTYPGEPPLIVLSATSTP